MHDAPPPCPRPTRPPTTMLECGHAVFFGLTRLPSNVKTQACAQCVAARRAALKAAADEAHARVDANEAERFRRLSDVVVR